MTSEKTEELLFEINGKLASIETKLDSMSETILKHESRLTLLEQNFQKHLSENPKSNDGDYKTQLLMLLGKCLIVSLTAVVSLAGGGSLLMKIIGS